MAYILRTTVTKPADAPWYPSIYDNQPSNRNYLQWVKQFPNVTAVNGTAVSDNVHTRAIIFTDKPACDAFLIAREQNSDYIHRREWQNAFQYTIEETQAEV